MKLTALTLFLLLSFTFAHAQGDAQVCTTNKNAPPVSAYYWPPDTSVKVYLVRDMFTDAQQQTLLAAMANWSRVSRQVNAGVSFHYAGVTDALMNCRACLTVTRRDVFKNDRKHYAFFTPLQRDQAGLLISAWIDFDNATTDPQALRGYMAHELAHGMGLWDCKTCKKNQTLMNAFPGVNKHNGLIEPSACDVDVVRNVYELERRVSSNAVSDNSRDDQ